MISSLVGILCGVGLLVGLVLGIVALSQLRQPGSTESGKGMAIAGVVIGGLGVLTYVLVIASGALHTCVGTGCNS
jgi:uncharacterized membrane protein